jgi:curved DNA-binding protein
VVNGVDMSTTNSGSNDLYRILGVARTADADEIKKAYRALAKQYHPDLNPGDKRSEEKFKEVSAAFAVLGDEKKRAIYDEFGADGLREGFDADAARNYKRWAQQSAGGRGAPGGDFGGMGGAGPFGGFGDLNDILGSLFGGGLGGGRQRTHRRGADTETEVVLSVREALEGVEVMPGDLPGRVRIPPGVATGQRIRVPGKGAVGPAGPGDLFIKVQVSPPIGFRVDPQAPDDLEVDLPVTIAQAMLGASVTVPTPEAGTVQLRVPAGAQSGQRLRLRGKGMPRKGGDRGDLLARLLVRVPRTDDPRAQELARELEQFYA